MTICKLRDILKTNRPVIGTLISFSGSPQIMLLMAANDLDFVIIDKEHGPFSDETVCSMVLAAKSTSLMTLVRPSSNQPSELGRLLDLGADGLMVPHIEDRKDVEEIIRATHYYPKGNRSVSFGQPHTAYKKIDPFLYTSTVNEEIIILIQLESADGLNNCDEILSTPGIDGFVIGVSDLASSLGIIGQANSKIIEDAISRILTIGKKNKLICGIASNEKDAKFRIEQGFDFIIIGSDSRLLSSAIEKIVNTYK